MFGFWSVGSGERTPFITLYTFLWQFPDHEDGDDGDGTDAGSKLCEPR